MRDVEKQYGGLRPLRVHNLASSRALSPCSIGFDRPAAETFVNLITGASLPDAGEVDILGRPRAPSPTATSGSRSSSDSASSAIASCCSRR